MGTSRRLDHLEWLTGVLTAAGIKVHVVSSGHLRRDALDPAHRFASMPLFVLNEDGSKGMIRRQCTSEYKLKPIGRKVRELAGLQPRQRHKDVLIRQWLGISWDEMQRMSDPQFSWITHHYPLVDLRMTRFDCHRWLRDRGYSAPRSACLGCPFHTDAEWVNIRDNDPKGWADAVEFDYAIRNGNVTDAEGSNPLLGEAYLHKQLVPLDQVVFDTPVDRGQGALFVMDEAGECGLTCGSEGVPAGFVPIELSPTRTATTPV